MRTQELVGEWYLPNSELKLSGKLLISHKRRKIDLILYTTHYIEGLKINFADHSHRQKYGHEIILGETASGSVTIVNCRWRLTKPIGSDFFEIRYQGSLVLHRVHIASISNLRAIKTLFKFPYLASWYDGWEGAFRLDHDQNTTPNSTREVIKVTDNLEVSFIDNFEKRPLKLGVSYKVEYEKLVEFQYGRPMHFDDVLKDAVRFSKLLEFSIRKKIEFKIFAITVDTSLLVKNDDKYGNTRLADVPITYFGSYTKSDLVNKLEIHQAYMLVSTWVLSKEEMNNVIKKWYANKDYFHIYDYYLDSHNWFEGTGAVLTNVMFNNRFLNLIQALESYHKKLDISYNQDLVDYNSNRSKVIDILRSQSPLDAWFIDYVKGPPENFRLRERLSNLITRLDPITKKLFGERNKLFTTFPNEAKEYRHKLSHGDVEGIDLGKPLVKLFYEAQFLLTLIILETLDFKESEISRLISHNQNCIRDINEIIHNQKV
jgi:hypothetical protein